MTLKIPITLVFCVLFNFILNGDKKFPEMTIEVHTTASRIEADLEKFSEAIDHINLSAIRNDVSKKFPSIDKKLISKIYLRSRSEFVEEKEDEQIINRDTRLYLVIYMTSKVENQHEILAFAERLTRMQLADLGIDLLP